MRDNTLVWFLVILVTCTAPCCDPVALDSDDSSDPGDDDATGDDDDSEDDDDDTGLVGTCPNGMVRIEGGTYTLGEWDETTLDQFYSHLIIEEQVIELDSFCIDDYSFPGRVGEEWPQDGMSLGMVYDFEAKVEPFGRRVCTVTELLLAAAGPDNWRFPYDPEERVDGQCEPDDLYTGIVVGDYPTCVSPLGVHDFMVRSTWARLSDPEIRVDCERGWADERGPDAYFPGEDFAVWGGTSRTDTFYAPSNFGIHFHNEGDGGGSFLDDGIRTCFTPGEWSDDQETAWQVAMDEFLIHNTFAAWLN